MATIDNNGENIGRHSSAMSDILSASAVEIQTRKIDYKNELIFYFFNAMLESVVESWEAFGDISCVDSDSSAQNIHSEPDEWVCNTEFDESTDTDSRSRISKYSFLRSALQMDEFKKNQTESVPLDKPRLSKKINRKSRKSIRKRTLSNLQNNNNDSLQELPSDTSWIIEPVDEYVIITFKNGNIYEGPVTGKLMHGSGKFTWADGTTYIGDFDHGDITGQGNLVLPDISRYVGGFLRGYRHGQGVMSVPEDGAIYRGGWRAGKKHSRGWQLFRPNNWYDGEWADDGMDGNGIRQYPSGARYQGDWKQSKRHGKGFAVMRNNDFYTGDWYEGKRKGYGEYTWGAFYNKTLSVPVQSSYFGSWDANKMHGIGLINFGTEGGARFAGCFENNKKHGTGVILCENGSSIESNPLFLYDKPIHLTQTGSFNISVNGERSISSSGTMNISSVALELIKKNFSDSYMSTSSSVERQLSVFKLITKQIFLPTNYLDNATIANIELCKLAFPKIQENYFSLCIPINTPSDMIVLNHYLKKITEYLWFSNTNPIIQQKDNIPIIGDIKATNHGSNESPKLKRSPASSLKENTCSSALRDHIECEEKNLRKAITSYLPKLRSIYNQYTTVACLKILPFKTLLIRLFLWQFYRDCMIPYKGISLIHIDDLMAENPDTELETEHGPFEIIYFWQFLHSLVAVSLSLYAKECSGFIHEGILKTSFVKLLEEDIFPNSGHHKGCALFDYVDVLPLKSAYKWFQEFKEPITALKFIRSACTIRACNPPSYFEKSVMTENVILRLGVNTCGVGHEITYLQDELPNIQTEPIVEEIKISDSESFQGLFFLRYLGAKTVLSILAEVCPHIKENNEIINVQYELTFLEFYEAVLLCTQKLINQENDKKLREKLAEEEKLLQGTEELSTNSLKGRKNSQKKKLKSKVQLK